MGQVRRCLLHQRGACSNYVGVISDVELIVPGGFLLDHWPDMRVRTNAQVDLMTSPFACKGRCSCGSGPPYFDQESPKTIAVSFS